MRRGWSALLALMLVLAGAGFGGGAARPTSVAAPAHAGAGSAEGRETLPVRAQSRLAVLAQRADDPPAATPTPDPVALPLAALGHDAAAPAGTDRRPHAAGAPAGLPRPYQARAPPVAA